MSLSGFSVRVTRYDLWRYGANFGVSSTVLTGGKIKSLFDIVYGPFPSLHPSQGEECIDGSCLSLSLLRKVCFTR